MMYSTIEYSLFVPPSINTESPSLSRVGGDLDKIESTPCSVTYGGLLMGHTVGGVTVSIRPIMRERKVDEFGETVVDLVQTGDAVEIKMRLAERSMKTISSVYAYGSEYSSTIWSIGRRPTLRAREVAKEMILHPLRTSGTAKDLVFYKVAPKENGEFNVGKIGDDQVFEVTFICLPDETKDDGNLIGRIGVPV